MSEPKPSAEEVFLQAIEHKSLADRAAYFASACAGDPELQARVAELLRQHDAAMGLLDVRLPVLESTQDWGEASERPGMKIGPYKLLEQIGQGGMGTVFVAQQTEPIHRRVAIKIIKPGMDSRAVIARFEAERQALAIMDHPNIAKVLDAGTTPTGRPFFVMELVKGVPITQFCDQRHLTPRERLELFVPVCQAVQHAHQKGIIHRDLKPSNVLVALYDDRPVPKVIDFGVAKATGARLTDATVYTEFGQVIGTLEYMSPEQAGLNQLDIDTRSDVYSLGVMLYELLTGTTPIERRRLQEGAILEMLRLIREEEPPPPSARLSTVEGLPSIAANRGLEPVKLNRLVRGDLDWIVMKALEKERNRRYESTGGLAADLQRFLHDEPVQACPPSIVYRCRKFVRRNGRGLLMVFLIGLATTLTAGTINWAIREKYASLERESARIARDEAKRKEREERVAAQIKQIEETRVAREAAERTAREERVNAQIQQILIDVDRLIEGQQWQEALAAAARAESVIAAGEPAAEIRQKVSQRLRDLSFLDRLERLRLRAVEWRRPGPDFEPIHREFARTFREYEVDLEQLGADAAIQKLKLQPAYAIPLAAGLENWAAKTSDGRLRSKLFDIMHGLDENPLRRQLRSMMRKTDPVGGHTTAFDADELLRITESIKVRDHNPQTLSNVAHCLIRAQQRDAALKLLREAQYAYPTDFWLTSGLASLLRENGDKSGAVRYYTAASYIRPDYAYPHIALGSILREQNDIDEAIRCSFRGIELDPETLSIHPYFDLGASFQRLGKLDEAIEIVRLGIARGNVREQSGKRFPSGSVSELTYNFSELLIDRAWQLMADHPRVENIKRALELGQECVSVRPDNPGGWQILGVAQYRSGNWSAALESLKKSRSLFTTFPDSVSTYYAAMAYWQLQDIELANQSFGHAEKWQLGLRLSAKQLRELQMEAAQLLKREVPVLFPGPKLLTPDSGRVYRSIPPKRVNGQLIGGEGTQIAFDWSDVDGASAYQIYIVAENALMPYANAHSRSLPESEHRMIKFFGLDGAFAGMNSEYSRYTWGYEPRTKWRWRVRASIDGVWTDWSDERTFEVLPLNSSQEQP